MLAYKALSAKLVNDKSPEAVAAEWDRIAHVRQNQISAGADISFNYVLKPTVLKLLEGCDLRRVIDLGCGTGDLTREIGLISGEVSGVDSSPISIEIAEETCSGAPNISLVAASIESFAKQGCGSSFGTAVANMTLMTCLDLDSFIESVAKVISPNGHFIATITHPWFWPNYWGYADASWFDYRKELVIEAPFKISTESTDYITTHVHRPLSAYLDSLTNAGFMVEKVMEPYPEKQVHSQYKESWKFPRFLAVRAVFDLEQTQAYREANGLLEQPSGPE